MPNTLEVLGTREVLSTAGSGDLTWESLQDVASAMFASDAGRGEVKALLEEWSTVSKGFTSATVAGTLQGYLLFLLGDLRRAEETLRKEKRNEWATYFLVKVNEGLGRLQEAVELATEARGKFSDNERIQYLAIELLLKASRIEEAQKLLQKFQSQDGSSALYAYHQGYALERSGEYLDAIEWYRKASELEPAYAEAHFRLGYLLDLYSKDDSATDAAIEAYELCLKITPVHSNAVVNLGVLYEDRERYHDATKCFETVLRNHPDHDRVRLYLEDAEACTRMFYDREQEKKADRHSQVLKIPVTDFELSVRSRNCLQKMNIDTLGDLVMKSEQELLSYKNFGETSLKEIKDMLGQKGLRLGMGMDDSQTGTTASSRNPLEASVSADVLDRSIDSLELSVRSRRCMERLEVKSVRDLINKTEVELMSAKNFGMTSLSEIKQKLDELNLSLRQ